MYWNLLLLVSAEAPKNIPGKLFTLKKLGGGAGGLFICTDGIIPESPGTLGGWLPVMLMLFMLLMLVRLTGTEAVLGMLGCGITGGAEY